MANATQAAAGQPRPDIAFGTTIPRSVVISGPQGSPTSAHCHIYVTCCLLWRAIHFLSLPRAPPK
eukprot:6723014-Prorocentrum_lima.AAC.1